MITHLLHRATEQELCSSAAPRLANRIRALLLKKEHVVVALPGGRSVIPLLQALKQCMSAALTAQWKRLQFFMLDERFVPLDHPDSNYGQIWNAFFRELVDQGRILPGQCHPFVCPPDTSLSNAAEAYTAQLQHFGGFDIVVLGAGEDGHVASLFPGHPALQEERPVFIAVPDSPKPPAMRITASKALIRNASTSVVLFFGSSKRGAFVNFCRPETQVDQCPATLVKGSHEVLILSTEPFVGVI